MALGRSACLTLRQDASVGPKTTEKTRTKTLEELETTSTQEKEIKA